ncbi:TcpE family conjugal transfer membrane protein [[Actinomadura] parvosata]|uniref:TcpE family conjugal transfer membrane protein n=1 Tax=[Actinomadura] parvosata TaxID=1955412 RepID=UPI00406C6376
MDLPTYTNIWRIEKRLYKLYDLRLPMPLPIVWIGVFVGVFVPWSLLLVLVGVPVQMPWHVLFLVPPGIVTWLSTRPVIEGKRLTELLESQLRYLGQPKAWYRLAPSSEPETVTFSGRVWRTGPARAKTKTKTPRKARQSQRKRDGQRLTGPRQVRPAVAAAAAAAAQAPVAEPPSRAGWGTRRGTAPALEGRVRQGAPAPAAWLEEAGAGRPVSLLDEAVGTAHGSPGPQYVDADLVEREDRVAEAPDESAVDTGETAAEDTGAEIAATGQEPDAAPLGAHEELSAETVAAREASVPIKTAESRKPAAGKPIDTEALRRLRRLAASADAPPETAAEPEARRTSERGEDEVARDQHRKGQPPRLPQMGLVLPGASQRVWPPLNPNAKPLPRPATRGAAEQSEPTAQPPSHPAPDNVTTSGNATGVGEAARSGDATGAGEMAGSGGATGAGETAHDQPQNAAPEAPAEALTAPEATGEAREPEPATEDSSAAPATDAGVAAAGDVVAPATDEPGDEGAGDREPSPADRLAAPADGEAQERREAASVQSVEAPADDVPQERREAASVRDAGRPDARATREARGLDPERAGAAPTRAGTETGPADAEPGPTDGASAPTGAAPERADVAPEPNGMAAEPDGVAEGSASTAHEATGGVRGGQAGDVVAPVPGPRPGEGKVRRVESVVGRDSGGWRRIAQVVVGGGGVRTDGSEIDEARARSVFSGGRRVVVLGCTGGAGQTTTALMLGHTLAQVRDDRIVAVDANTGGGSLTSKIQPETPETLTSLLSGLDRVSGYLTMRGYTTRTASGLEVVSADTDAGAEQRLADRSFFSDHRLGESMRLLDRHYKLAVIDPAAALAARLLPYADQLVLVVPASEEAPEAVAMTYEWLDGHGCAELRRRAVMVVNGVSRRSMTDVEQAESVARGRCRAIVRVPWEDDLAPGGAEVVDPGQLRAAGRRAYLALAGVVVAGFAAQTVRTSEEELASDPPGTRIGER